MPGEHDQQRHAPVSVTRGSANIPKGQYDSHGSAPDRWTAEKQMNQLAGVKNYKDANKAGWFTVKVGDQYHIVNVKGPAQSEPVTQPPKPKELPEHEPAAGSGVDPTLAIRPGKGFTSGVREISGDGTASQKRKVQETLMLLPAQHQAHLFDVGVYDASDLGEAGYGTSSSGSAVGQADYNSLSIRVAGRESDADLRLTALHEAGHLVFNREPVSDTTDEWRNRRDEARKKLAGVWIARARAVGHKMQRTGNVPSELVARKMHLVTAYAACNAEEYRSESYSYYVHNPKVLKKKDPETYAILKDFFDGQEY